MLPSTFLMAHSTSVTQYRNFLTSPEPCLLRISDSDTLTVLSITELIKIPDYGKWIPCKVVLFLQY